MTSNKLLQYAKLFHYIITTQLEMILNPKYRLPNLWKPPMGQRTIFSRGIISAWDTCMSRENSLASQNVSFPLVCLQPTISGARRYYPDAVV